MAMKPNQVERIIKNHESDEAADISAEYLPHGYPEPEKFLEILEQNNPELVETYQTVLELCDRVRSAGGSALLVGGSVRDYYCNLIPKDHDIEIHRLTHDEIKEIAEEFGTVSEVGASFAIQLLTLPNGDTVDISMPRWENKTGKGHKGFDITPDPLMGVKDAALRRDFTINSLAANPLTGEVYNYYGGLQDIKDRILRLTNEDKFREDAVRVLRGAQFVARMDLKVDPQTFDFMKSIAPELADESKGRFKEEWDKLLVKGWNPSEGLKLLKDLGVLEHFHPELEVLSDVPQEMAWHPEGDVWKHTLLAVDAANEHLNDFDLDKQQKLNVMLATLCHDLGKVTTTKFNNERQKITSHGHEQAGAEPTSRFLDSIGIDRNNIEHKRIVKLVTEHLSPTLLYASRFEGNQRVKVAADGAIRRLAKRIHPATIRELVAVATADHLGRGPFAEEDGQILFNLYTAGDWLVKEAEKLGVDQEPPKKLISGQALIALGFKPGKNVGLVLNLSDNLRDSKGLKEEDVLGQIIISKPEGVQSREDEEEVIKILEGLLKE